MFAILLDAYCLIRKRFTVHHVSNFLNEGETLRIKAEKGNFYAYGRSLKTLRNGLKRRYERYIGVCDPDGYLLLSWDGGYSGKKVQELFMPGREKKYCGYWTHRKWTW